MFEKILVPIDGSEHSMKALKHGAEIAKRCESEKLAVINVYSDPVLATGVEEEDDLYSPSAR